MASVNRPGLMDNAKENMLMDTEVNYIQETTDKRMAYRFWKRFFDIVLSSMALVAAMIIMIPVSIAIKLEDGGPVFFYQDRNGLNGKVFRMYKLRTMCQNAQQMHFDMLDKNELDGPAFKMHDDPRITRVGKFLRRTSIDELPQLINIIKGDMSIVGPRPLPTYETEKCNAYQMQRYLVKPGLTCYWQCMGRDTIPFDRWVELDLKYIREASLWTDIKIIIKTIISVIVGDGAY
ncbi:MAG: sugar transferase [Lachnospiraceae bacterium]|nr:sugar transferase [Lachnospiraceae bacterium]